MEGNDAGAREVRHQEEGDIEHGQKIKEPEVAIGTPVAAGILQVGRIGKSCGTIWVANSL